MNSKTCKPFSRPLQIPVIFNLFAAAVAYLFSVETEWGAHAPSRVVFGALAEHILAPAAIKRHQEISRALFRSARRRPVQPRAAALPTLIVYAVAEDKTGAPKPVRNSLECKACKLCGG